MHSGKCCQQLWDLLYIKDCPKFAIDPPQIINARAQCLRSRLVCLPQEILHSVTANLSGEDVACLALTCRYLYYAFGAQLQRLLLQDNAPWAGDRLIFIYEDAHGAPSGVITEAEQQVFDTGRGGPESDDEDNRPGDAEHWMSKMKRQPLVGEPLVSRVVTTQTRGQLEKVRLENPMDLVFGTHIGGLNFSVRKRILKDSCCDISGDLSLFDRLCDRLLGTDKPCTVVEDDRRRNASIQTAILRNLCTKEYVRNAALVEMQSSNHLGDLLCAQAMFPGNDEYDLGVGWPTGPWAGHRFDIVNEREVQGHYEWTDVSDDAVKFFKKAIRGFDNPYD